MEKTLIKSEDFYQKVDLILGSQLPGKTVGYGRWRRGAGSGRYKDIGIIRYYSNQYIHVIFHNPPLNKVYSSEEDVILELQDIFKTS